MRRSRATGAPRCANFVGRCGSMRRDTASNINEARQRTRQVTIQEEKWASAARPKVVQPFRSGTRCHFTNKGAVQLLEFRRADHRDSPGVLQIESTTVRINFGARRSVRAFSRLCIFDGCGSEAVNVAHRVNPRSYPRQTLVFGATPWHRMKRLTIII